MLFRVDESFDLATVKKVFATLTERTEPSDWREKSVETYRFNKNGISWYGRTCSGMTRWRVTSGEEALENLVAANLWPWESSDETAPRWACAACEGVCISRDLYTETTKVCERCFDEGGARRVPSSHVDVVAWALFGAERLRRMNAILREMVRWRAPWTLITVAEPRVAYHPYFSSSGSPSVPLDSKISPVRWLGNGDLGLVLRPGEERSVDWKRFSPARGVP